MRWRKRYDPDRDQEEQYATRKVGKHTLRMSLWQDWRSYDLSIAAYRGRYDPDWLDDVEGTPTGPGGLIVLPHFLAMLESAEARVSRQGGGWIYACPATDQLTRIYKRFLTPRGYHFYPRGEEFYKEVT